MQAGPWIAAALALGLVLVGCGAPKGSDQASGTHATATGDARTAAAGKDGAPVEIVELSDQRLVYECAKCGMMFAAAGTCSMDGDTLVANRVDYTCPADGQPVAHAGQCPRCAMNARVQKTALAAEVPPPAQSGR